MLPSDKYRHSIFGVSSGYLRDKQEARYRQPQNCNLETTKVLKFPKIFDHPRKKQYLCTLFVIWHSTHKKTSTIYLHQGSGNEVVTEQLKDLQ